MSGRVLGVDPGDVRVGVAISDPLGLTAQPLPAVSAKAEGGPVAALTEIVRREHVVEIVVGLPLLMSGEEGDRARLARSLASRLEQALDDVRVVLWDERLTSAQAEREMRTAGVGRKRRRQRVDTVAAALILQSYLDSVR